MEIMRLTGSVCVETNSHDDIEKRIGQIVDVGVVPLSVGGDHSITHPILKAVGRKEPVGLIHIDAHCDTSGAFDQTKFHHGGPFRNAVLDGVLDPTRTIQIGIRGSAEYLWEFSYKSGMTVIHAEDLSTMGIAAIVAKAKSIVGDGPTYPPSTSITSIRVLPPARAHRKSAD
jgi:agmatinase